MSITLVTTADVVKTPKSVQQQVLRFVIEHDVDAEQCFGIAHEPGNGYVADQVTFSLYDLRDGDKYYDEAGEVATYQVTKDLIGELPHWWAGLAKAQTP